MKGEKIRMKDLAERFHEVGVVPVVVLEDAKDAVPLAQALVEGGLPCAEVTFRTAAAEESIRLMAEKFPEMLVGAGTVLTTEQVDAAVKAGAKFIVSPGFDPEIVDYCLKKEIPVLPGCISPSEVAQAVKRGLKTVKFFPAEQAGGIAMIKAMAAPYTGIKFMPTGGINAKNKELDEAANIDGCGHWKSFFLIMLPIAKPGVVVVAVFSFVYAWGDLIYGITFITNPNMRPITSSIYNYVQQYQTLWNSTMAFGIIAISPVVLIFIFMQRYIVSGLTNGAVKA